MIADIYTSRDTVSKYQPPKEVADITSIIQKDYSFGNEILNRSWTELNERSVISDMNRGQRTFNAFVDESVEDPTTAWQWRGTRSKARNKAIAMHAQLTAGYIIPVPMAQNENDEEDRDMSDIMRDVMEWMVYNSNYKTSFLSATMGMLMNPVTYLGADFNQVLQKIKTKTDQGFEIREVLDDVYSGFNAPVMSADQVLISNVYEQNIQKQRVIIEREYKDYSEIEAKYGDHPNWQFVQAGVKSIYNSEDGLFYDVKDDDHPFLVEEAIHKHRREDSEIPFINGIYMGDDDIEANPMKHRDHQGRPKYNKVPFGYQRVNEHFFYYKSLMNSMYWDNQLIDAQYELGMNRAFLDTNMPVAVTGTDKIDTDIIFPSAVIALKDKETSVTPILPQANLQTIFGAMDRTEKSMEEGSVSDTQSGTLPAASQKATSVALAERNAKTLLQGVGKTLAESVVQYGGLMADVAVNHLSVPEVDEMLGDMGKLKYRTLILSGSQVGSREVDKVLKFDEGLLGARMNKKQMEEANLRALEEVGFPNNKHELYRINPEQFAKMKYMVRVEPERMFPMNEEFKQAIYSQVYAQLRADPFVDGEALVRKVMRAYFREESEDLIAKQQIGKTGQVLNSPEQTQFGQQAQNIASNNALQGNLQGVGR